MRYAVVLVIGAAGCGGNVADEIAATGADGGADAGLADVTPAPHDAPIEVGASDATDEARTSGIRRGGGWCAPLIETCCISYEGGVSIASCVQGMLSQCPLSHPGNVNTIACDDPSDCQHGEVCCAHNAFHWGVEQVGCSPTCATGELNDYASELCDPAVAGQCAAGQVCAFMGSSPYAACETP
jgi:hypothetical protein